MRVWRWKGHSQDAGRPDVRNSLKGGEKTASRPASDQLGQWGDTMSFDGEKPDRLRRGLFGFQEPPSDRGSYVRAHP